MKDTRVLEARVGSMPHAAEVALANARSARALRHAARCNCGHGRTGAGCSLTETDRPGSAVLTGHAAAARERMNRYRRNRVWSWSGSTPRPQN